ncbi:hypothetical protein FRC07_012261 [Ceratobasidium sp. 392]|nr:hypothetical protein FRC07_012261 [Ceratobasidium sp. 392]
MLFYYNEISRAERVGERNRLQQEYGVNGRPVFARLGSIDLANCAPYDMMHLIFLNLVPNLVEFWKGEFKWLDHNDKAYVIGGNVWQVIGELTTKAVRTIPSQFVGTLPDIHKDSNLYKAEAYSFWFTYLAPILLGNNRLNRVYYEHFLRMREIVLWCLELEISRERVDALEVSINEWVQEYERLYYRYDHDRLPCCVLTIHALLHIPHYIRQTGPLSGTWCFVMERFCGLLLKPALANRVRPYDYLDNFIRRRAQMRIVAHVHNMPSLVRPVANLVPHETGELISSKERMYNDFPNYVLGQPVNRTYRVTDPLKRQMVHYFGLAEGPRHEEGPRPTFQQVLDRIAWETLVRYGRFRLASMGDRVRVADLIQADPVARDNSFVRYELLPDRYAHLPRARDHPMRQVHYGRVQDVFYVEYIRDLATNERVPYLLARVQPCNTQAGLDAARPNHPTVTYNRLLAPQIIHLGTVDAAVGRVWIGGRNTWAIVDRSRSARTQFNDENGLADPDLE